MEPPPKPSARSASYLTPATSGMTLPTPSPRPHRGLRKLQSAHTLTSHSSTPSLVIQRQQQQLQQQQQLNSSARKDQSNTISSPQQFSRSRSNSDAAVTSLPSSVLGARRMATSRKLFPVGQVGKNKTLEGLVRDGPISGDVTGGLRDLRYLVLTDGIRSDTDGMSSIRGYIWLILLCAQPLPTDQYLDLIHRGPSPAYPKIRNDTFRTLATDPLFRRRVSEASLIRLLNAIAWKLHDAKIDRLAIQDQTSDNVYDRQESLSPPTITLSAKHARGPPTTTTTSSSASASGATEPGTYVQGMNVLAAPFLYAARSEAEAFVAFHRFITLHCPAYVRGAMDGVHKGLSLVDRVLAHVDSRLSVYLLSKGLHAKLYAFPSVLTLCACTPPLPEVLHLWDFLFAFGTHLNILCIVAQVVLMRDTIMESPSPMKVLRSFPPLQAAKVKAVAISILAKISDELYHEIVIHAK
ncbi:MAG: hypothetical protein M1819_002531 [Sarea resinae]|nr:MAG: hypothetical protein M1819_002531 [Sarea resinae]